MSLPGRETNYITSTRIHFLPTHTLPHSDIFMIPSNKLKPLQLSRSSALPFTLYTLTITLSQFPVSVPYLTIVFIRSVTILYTPLHLEFRIRRARTSSCLSSISSTTPLLPRIGLTFTLSCQSHFSYLDRRFMVC